MNTSWDAKHDPENLIDAGEYEPVPPGGRMSSYQPFTNEDGFDKNRDSNHYLENPYVSSEDRYSYLEPSPFDDYRESESSTQVSLHKSTHSDGFSSKGTLVKSAADISGTGEHDDNIKPPISQFGSFSSCKHNVF